MAAPLLRYPDDLTLGDKFCGYGGSTDGAATVPGVRPVFAANHKPNPIEVHAANWPGVDHYLGDIVSADITRFPYVAISWDSPACPPWTDARGVKRDFDTANQQALFGEPTSDVNTMRARALMEEVPRYLRYWADRGRPVLAGVVENVVQCRKWHDWRRWINEIRSIGPYEVRVIAFNSMHARPVRSKRAPQSRDRLYVAYWLKSLGRAPDWRKWLSPLAYCPTCDETVSALQVFKQPGTDMGRYGAQYNYRCPNVACRNAIVEPDVLPALVAIDWTLPGTRIGDRAKPLADKTRARIRAGLDRYAVPMLTPAGGTWRNDAVPVTDPMTARTTRENDGLAVPPLLVPVEGRPGKTAAPATVPMRTQTARNETGLAWLPFLAELRGGSCDARPVTDRMATITASGNHMFLCTPDTPPAGMVMRNNTPRGGDGGHLSTPLTDPLRSITTAGHQSLITWEHLLVPYYGNGTARPVTHPIGTLTSRDRYALATGRTGADIDVDDVLFRMLEPHEIRDGMAFRPDYLTRGSKRDVVRGFGNAVTPPVAEVIVSALVEAITGEDLAR